MADEFCGNPVINPVYAGSAPAMVIHMSRNWDDGYKHLLEYNKACGNSLVPSSYICCDGYKLGNWVVANRYSYTHGMMSQERIKLLKEADFNFQNANENADNKWKEAYYHLFEYANTYGNSNVPNTYICPDGFRLGRWVLRQRTVYRTARISTEHQKLLEKLDFQFCYNASKNTPTDTYMWKNGYDHVVDFYHQYGHSIIPWNYKTSDGYNLWLLGKSKTL